MAQKDAGKGKARQGGFNTPFKGLKAALKQSRAAPPAGPGPVRRRAPGPPPAGPWGDRGGL